MRKAPSIQAMLILLVAAVAVCGLAVYGAALFTFAQSSQRAAAEASGRLSALAVQAVSAWLDRFGNTIETVASFLEHSGKPDAAFAATLDDVIASSAGIKSFRVLDERGRIFFLVNDPNSYIGGDLSTFTIFRQASGANGPVWSGILYAIGSRDREIVFALDSGKFVILATLDFEVLAGAMTAILGTIDAGLALTDSGGLFLVHAKTRAAFSGQMDAPFLETRVRASDSSVFEYERHEERGTTTVRAERIPKLGWYVLVERPADHALAVFKATLPVVSVLALAVIVLASTFAGLSSFRLLRDVRKAQAESERSYRTDTQFDSKGLYFRETRAICVGVSRTSEQLRDREESNRGLAELNTRLEETLARLEKAQDALVESEKLATMGILAANVAHELNSPIAASESAIGFIETEALAMLRSMADGRVSGFGEDEESRRMAGAFLKAIADFSTATVLIGSERRAKVRELAATLLGGNCANDDANRGANDERIAARTTSISTPAIWPSASSTSACIPRRRAISDSSARCARRTANDAVVR